MERQFTFMKRKTARFNLREKIRDFLDAKRLENRSERTIKSYRQALEKFAEWIEEQGEEIDEGVVKRYVHYLRNKKKKWEDHPTSPTKNGQPSPRHINNYIRILKVFFNYLMNERIISFSPVEGVKLLRENRDTFEIFTDEDVLKLLDAPNKRVYTGFRDYCMMLVLIDTGLRIRELTNLRVSDVNLKLRQITVPHNITKSGVARVVPISHRTAKELQTLINFINVGPDDYLWLTQFGERYTANTFAKMLKKYAKKAGVTGVRVSPHTFRHYFAVKFLKENGDPMALMRILGHTDMSMTERYVRYTEVDLQETHDKASPVTHLLEKGNAKKRGKVIFK